jgi:uncharacterized protein (UPF0262 family)
MFILYILIGIILSFIAVTSSDDVFDHCIKYREIVRKVIRDYYAITEDYFIHKLLKL